MLLTRGLRLGFLLASLSAAACQCDGDTAADAGSQNRTDAGAPLLPDGGAIDGGAADAGFDAGAEEPGFPYATGCHLPPDQLWVPTFTLEDAFPSLPSFESAIFMTHADDGRLFVVERGGSVWSFANDPATSTRTEFLDLSGRIEAGGEKGLLGLAFHPNFATNGLFFVSYTRSEGGVLYSFVSRMSVSSSDPTVADLDSEVVLLRERQPFGNHNGGMIAFGPDDYLYVGLGDGGSGGDPEENGQDVTTALGAILRIDVDNTEGELNYAIPPGNPFAGSADDARREIFAWGFRNPWRFSFDREAGTLFAGDVGQGGGGQQGWEEIDVVEAGKNYGWNTMEGNVCYPPSGAQDCDTTGLELPVAVYSHDFGNSVTGGYVYRGEELPFLEGKYVYGDYGSGKIFLYDPATGAFSDEHVATSPEPLSSFGEDAAGELYAVGFSAGRLYRFTPSAVPGDAGPFPETLAETGCFDDVQGLVPVEGALPYEVGSPLWSDGSSKQRWLVLPHDGLVTLSLEGWWDLPEGTVLIKQFDLDTTPGDPSTRERLETRFIVVEADGVRGYTYRWREDGSEADLLTEGETRTFQLTDSDGGTETYTWQYPSRDACQRCHTPASGGVLGVETAQLNREGSLAGEEGNQLEALEALALLEAPLPAAPSGLPRFFAAGDEDASVEARARAYLHSNCAGCHLPGGPTGRALDLRYSTPLADMNVCDVPPQGTTLTIEDPRLVVPGDPERSLLYRRMRSVSMRMPPIASSVFDEEGSAVVAAWITQLEECP